MGLINIDDRDVNNYYSVQPDTTKYKELLLQLKSTNLTSKVVSLGLGHYMLSLPIITCIGSDVETRISIPFLHDLFKMELKHVDSSGSDSTDSLKYIVQRQNTQNLLLILYKKLTVIMPDIVDEYEGFMYETCQYLLTTNTTNADKLYISFYIKYIGD